MKKRIKGVKLSRKKGARQALAKNLVKGLIFSGRITTTKARAKFTQKYAEKLVRLAKKNSLAANRRIFAAVSNKAASKKLIQEIRPKFSAISSGFTRIINLGERLGDRAPMALLEFAYPKKVDTKEDKVKMEERPKAILGVKKTEGKRAQKIATKSKTIPKSANGKQNKKQPRA